MSSLWMIAYDITDDRGRRRVHNILKDHGERVQYSVFECWLNAPTLSELRRRIREELETADSVRWYPLCAWCKEGVHWQGVGKPPEDPDYYLL